MVSTWISSTFVNELSFVRNRSVFSMIAVAICIESGVGKLYFALSSAAFLAILVDSGLRVRFGKFVNAN